MPVIPATGRLRKLNPGVWRLAELCSSMTETYLKKKNVDEGYRARVNKTSHLPAADAPPWAQSSKADKGSDQKRHET